MEGKREHCIGTYTEGKGQPGYADNGAVVAWVGIALDKIAEAGYKVYWRVAVGIFENLVLIVGSGYTYGAVQNLELAQRKIIEF